MSALDRMINDYGPRSDEDIVADAEIAAHEYWGNRLAIAGGASVAALLIFAFVGTALYWAPGLMMGLTVLSAAAIFAPLVYKRAVFKAPTIANVFDETYLKSFNCDIDMSEHRVLTKQELQEVNALVAQCGNKTIQKTWKEWLMDADAPMRVRQASLAQAAIQEAQNLNGVTDAKMMNERMEMAEMHQDVVVVTGHAEPEYASADRPLQSKHAG